MHVAIFLATCDSLTNRDLVDRGMAGSHRVLDSDVRESGWSESLQQHAGSDLDVQRSL